MMSALSVLVPVKILFQIKMCSHTGDIWEKQSKALWPGLCARLHGVSPPLGQLMSVTAANLIRDFTFLLYYNNALTHMSRCTVI